MHLQKKFNSTQAASSKYLSSDSEHKYDKISKKAEKKGRQKTSTSVFPSYFTAIFSEETVLNITFLDDVL